MDATLLTRVANLYDPSRQMAKLSFRNMASSKINRRYWSLTSLTTISSEMHERSQKVEEVSTVEDVVKFFIFVLLMLCHKVGYPKFCKELMEYERKKKLTCETSTIHACSPSNAKDIVINHSPIACGQAHVAYIHNGTLYSWGKSGNGRLGTEDIGIEYQSPQPVLTLLRLQVNVLAVSCGALHTLALTDFGLFGWGSSRFGQLGMGEVQQTIQPRIIESLLKEKIMKIHCGQYHSIALTFDGKVFTWGWGIHGQLGHGNAEDLTFPKVIESLKRKRFISISAGQGHSVLLSKNGDVYTFGCGMFGQLGTGSALKQSRPQLVNIPERMKLIASGYFHVLAISRINKVYTWGCNPQALRLQAQNSRRARHHGSMANHNSLSSHHVPPSPTIGNHVNSRPGHVNGTVQQSHLLPNLVNTSSITDTIIQVSCGSHHSVLVTACGKIFSWGKNSEGQIGNGTRKEQKIPNLVVSLKDKKIEHAVCGADFTIAIDSSGKIFGWGQNDNAQIGQKPSVEPNTKYNSGSASGRVITIRTNRRMITITQPCRQSILRPVEIAVTLYDVKKTGLFDSGSFENDYSIMQLVDQNSSNSIMQDGPDLSNLCDPQYCPYVLHSALEVFHTYCESFTLLNHCLNFGNFQAAAKLCAVENMYDQALEHQLTALISHSLEVDLQMALYIIDYYTNMVIAENIDTNRNFLCHVINFWLKNDLPMSSLESFFLLHQNIFLYPLSLIMFSENIPNLDHKDHNEFLRMLSSKFWLTITYEVLRELQQGYQLAQLLAEMSILSETVEALNPIHTSDSLATWDDGIPQDRLWLDIMHNLQTGVISHSSILLSANDVDLLTKSFISEKFYIQSFNNSVATMNKLNAHAKDSVIFSCGHHHTLPAFQANILPLFKDSLQTLFYSVPQTVKLLLAGYQEDIINVACPKCVAAEISNDL